MLVSGPFGGIILRSKKKSKIPRLLPRTYLAHCCRWSRLAAGLLAEQVITTHGPASGCKTRTPLGRKHPFRILQPRGGVFRVRHPGELTRHQKKFAEKQRMVVRFDTVHTDSEFPKVSPGMSGGLVVGSIQIDFSFSGSAPGDTLPSWPLGTQLGTLCRWEAPPTRACSRLLTRHCN